MQFLKPMVIMPLSFVIISIIMSFVNISEWFSVTDKQHATPEWAMPSITVCQWKNYAVACRWQEA
jgi:hypothetical protein